MKTFTVCFFCCRQLNYFHFHPVYRVVKQGHLSCLMSLLKINQGRILSIQNQSLESFKNKPFWSFTCSITANYLYHSTHSLEPVIICMLYTYCIYKWIPKLIINFMNTRDNDRGILRHQKNHKTVRNSFSNSIRQLAINKYLSIDIWTGCLTTSRLSGCSGRLQRLIPGDPWEWYGVTEVSGGGCNFRTN